MVFLPEGVLSMLQARVVEEPTPPQHRRAGMAACVAVGLPCQVHVAKFVLCVVTMKLARAQPYAEASGTALLNCGVRFAPNRVESSATTVVVGN